MRTIIFLLLSNVLVGQINNPQFEDWDFYNGREKPAEWFCPNLCPSSECGPCGKIAESAIEAFGFSITQQEKRIHCTGFSE